MKYYLKLLCVLIGVMSAPAWASDVESDGEGKNAPTAVVMEEEKTPDPEKKELSPEEIKKEQLQKIFENWDPIGDAVKRIEDEKRARTAEYAERSSDEIRTEKVREMVDDDRKRFENGDFAPSPVGINPFDTTQKTPSPKIQRPKTETLTRNSYSPPRAHTMNEAHQVEEGCCCVVCCSQWKDCCSDSCHLCAKDFGCLCCCCVLCAECIVDSCSKLCTSEFWLDCNKCCIELVKCPYECLRCLFCCCLCDDRPIIPHN